MKALLVGASPSGAAEHVAALAREADVVVAIDGGGALCLMAGVTPALVVGDLDSLDAESSESLSRAGIPFQTHPAEKDETDLGLAIAAARRLGADRIILTAVIGGRFDHSLAGVGAAASASDLRPRISEVDVSILILSGLGLASAKVVGGQATFSAMAVGGDAEISIRGAQWPLDRAILPPMGSLGVSNRVSGDEARVSVHGGVIALVAPTVGGVKAVLQEDD